MRLLEFKGEKKEYEEDYITFCASKICWTWPSRLYEKDPPPLQSHKATQARNCGWFWFLTHRGLKPWYWEGDGTGRRLGMDTQGQSLH